MRFFLFGLILVASAARAGDDWTTSDTVRQGILTGLIITDWAQTREIVAHPEKYRERNPFLGAYPSQGKLNNIVALSIVGSAVISYVLPRQWREAFQYVWIGAEAVTVIHNRSIGIRIPF
ncbi:MAG TPA: hypothetical protein VE008_07400 [Burkholderiales bacterium]|nr:hypothetical protein [Burkholderiales bacterium]